MYLNIIFILLYEQVSLNNLPATGLVIKAVGDIYLDIFYFSCGWNIDETISFLRRCKVSTYTLLSFIFFSLKIIKYLSINI